MGKSEGEVVLKPCPFCGNADLDAYQNAETADYCVSCSKCGATGEQFCPWVYTNFEPTQAIEKAIEAWNRRAEGWVSAATLEEVVKALGLAIKQAALPRHLWSDEEHTEFAAALARAREIAKGGK